MPFSSIKFIRFLVAGIPGILIAIALNYILVQWLNCPFFLAYALVLLVQVSLNFLACRLFVFNVQKATTSVIRQYLLFLSGILFFRLGDWLLYIVLVHSLPAYFLAIQIFNALLFSTLKFKYSTHIMEPA